MEPHDHSLLTAEASAHNARHNIALYHREHMRFNATLILEVAADMSREANRLKVFGDYWQRDAEPARTPPFDTSDRRFGAAGCPDLNPLSAVASAGILFMEGQGQPEEIRMLKEKLKSEGERFANKGQWLVDVMKLTWNADRVLLDPATPDAWPWISVLSVTLRGAKQRLMAGKLLLVALDYLERVDFTPAGVRSNRAESGRLLLLAAWSMDAAAALFSENAASLSRDDIDMVDYLSFFENSTPTHL